MLNEISFFKKNIYPKKAFFYALLMAFLMFIPFIIYDQGYFLYYGDFDVQQIPFYRLIHDSIRSSNFFWSFNTDLGANLIGSYSFYLISSPFFWLTIPFKSEAVPYLMAPLLMLKFSLASLTAYMYLSRYVKNKNLAVLGGILYAFSGFSIYNIFFNHFHEAIVIFPLLLWSLDLFMYDKKRGIFGLLVFASCCLNYYFFVSQVVFILIYWSIKMMFKSYKCTLKEFGILAFEAILGVLLSMVILLPSILTVMQNSRVDEHINGWYAILYDTPQRYLHIIHSMFFPPDIPARPNFTPDSNSKWASISLWLPFFGMCGVIGFIQSKTSHWLKRLLVVLFVFSMIPLLNSTFQLFNACYYARWFYTATLMMSLATILSLESVKTNWERAIKWSLIITLSISLSIGLMPVLSKNNGEQTLKFGLEVYPSRLWMYTFISIFSIIAFTFIIKNFYQNRKTLYTILMIFTMIVSLSSSIYIISLGKIQSPNTNNYMIPYVINGKNDLALEDTKNCRADFYECIDNQGMFWQIPTIQAFHSVVPGSIMEFYKSIGVKRDVASRPKSNVYAIRSLLSCRWLFDYKNDSHNFFDSSTNKTVMPGYKFHSFQSGHDIWENEYYIPFGFSYDNYITTDQFMGINESDRHLALLKAIVLDNDDVAKYNDILSFSSPNLMSYTQDEYFKDCIDRKKGSCYYFDRDNNGFTAKIDLSNDKDKLIFFSIPYEKGWRAEINGEKVEITKANIGFMAVRAFGGKDNTIRFSYKTPGLTLGLIISIISLLIFIAYKLFIDKYLKQNEMKSNKLIYNLSSKGDYYTLYISKLKHKRRD